MYLRTLTIEGYKCFKKSFKVNFAEGLNVLVGENATGKSAIIDSIRLLLHENGFERLFIEDTDFHKPFDVPDKKTQRKDDQAEVIRVSANFDQLNSTEQVAFLPWTAEDSSASLHLQVDNKQNNKNWYERKLWGGESRLSTWELELYNTINCIYLPPLRDAEAKLREGKKSRLALLIKNLAKTKLAEVKVKNEKHPIVKQVESFNADLATGDNEIKVANKLINDRISEALGSVFGQDTMIQYSETSFNRIAESLRLTFFPEIGCDRNNSHFRDLKENSLGYNNLIYIATVLAELSQPEQKDSDIEFLKILLIEEPEAHLHPQLQIKLLKYLETQAKKNKIQVIVTTHSPVLASAVSLDSIIHLCKNDKDNYQATSLKECGLPDQSKNFVSRWLDVTKSTLLFAKGVILVEGISEAMLVPEFAKRILEDHNKATEINENELPYSLEEAGVSVVNMNGIYFKHFMQLFCNIENEEGDYINIRCAGITDCDPGRNKWPFLKNQYPCENNKVKDIIVKINKSSNVRLLQNHYKTFEYDLALDSGNTIQMIQTLIDNWSTDGDVKKEMEEIKGEIKREEVSIELLSTKCNKIVERIAEFGKGHYAQILADELEKKSIIISVPDYIRKAVIWACGGEIND
jgi:putative ATP-dependent endonuclease of the OLD family